MIYSPMNGLYLLPDDFRHPPGKYASCTVQNLPAFFNTISASNVTQRSIFFTLAHWTKNSFPELSMFSFKIFSAYSSLPGLSQR